METGTAQPTEAALQQNAKGAGVVPETTSVDSQCNLLKRNILSSSEEEVQQQERPKFPKEKSKNKKKKVGSKSESRERKSGSRNLQPVNAPVFEEMPVEELRILKEKHNPVSITDNHKKSIVKQNEVENSHEICNIEVLLEGTVTRVAEDLTMSDDPVSEPELNFPDEIQSSENYQQNQQENSENETNFPNFQPDEKQNIENDQLNKTKNAENK